MDRGKLPNTGRGNKNKVPQHPQDIFALGTKSTVVVSRDADTKRPIHKPSTSGVDRKRDTAPTIPAPPPKKPKLTATSSSPSDLSGPSISLEIEPVELVPSVLQALDTHNSDKLLGLLTGAIRLLKAQRWKPDPILSMSLMYLAKIRPNMFAHDTVSQSLCCLLKREQGAAFKSKGNPTVFVLACNLLYAGHRENKNWPDGFIKVYIEDALNERWWVDCVWCKCLVENIVTAFNTKVPPQHLIPSENNTLGTMSPSGSGSPLLGAGEDDPDLQELEYSVMPRYSGSYEAVEAIVLESIKEQLSRRSTPDAIGKGFLKLLSATCGFPEIRMLCACRLEGWLHSGKLWRAAQDTLAHVCVNADPTSQRDHELLAHLVKMRLKTKPLVAAYIACIKEMVSESPQLLRSVVTHMIYNELSNVRSPNNMSVLASLIQAQPQTVPQAMAETYQELLLRPEEYLRPLRLLTRDCVRAARGDVVTSLVVLCRALAAPPRHDPPAEIRERAFSSIADLFCLSCLVTASHSKYLPEYKHQISTIQYDGVSWMLDAALPIYRAGHQEYMLALQKLMFLEPIETYCRLDNWPPESERTLTYRMCCEVPLLQNTLLKIIYIGLAKELPLTPNEAFDLIEQVVRRACALPPEENPLPIEKIEIADYIFQLCQYQPLENVPVPAGYTPPALVTTSLYWRAWLLLVMIAAHNPDSFAKQAFFKYPTLKALIEMCITNKFSVDWAVVGDPEADKAAVAQIESHLSAAKIPVTEQLSKSLAQVTIMDPTGEARRPPSGVCDCLSAMCSQLKLGRLLCGQPALLLDIVERHGTRRAMPWLHELLHDEHHSLSVLPVQCLCEFLVAGGGEKALELAKHLQRTLDESLEGARAVLAYYLTRLSHSNALVRTHANRGLKLVLTPIEDEETTEMEWNADVGPDQWVPLIWKTRHWEGVRGAVCNAVRAAITVEAEPRRLAAYIAFLAQYALTAPLQSVHHILLDLSQLLMERMTIMATILPSSDDGDVEEEDPVGPHHTLYALTITFHNFLQKIRGPGGAAALESVEATSVGAGERVMLEWGAGERCRLHVVLPHAAIKLLCLGPSKLDSDGSLYSWLVNVWLNPGPTSYTIETNEESVLLPDWLRLHLVRSARPILVQAGLRGLDAHRLSLFIQTFGMPVTSVSALLSSLDACPAGAVCKLGVERGYMAQLLGVQKARGALGGDAFSATLQLQEPHYQDDSLFDEPKQDVVMCDTSWDNYQTEDAVTLEQVGPLFATTFIGSRIYTGDVDYAFSALQMKISEEIKSMKKSAISVQDCPYIQCIVIYMGMILSSMNCYQFVSGFLSNSTYSVPLMRLLLTCKKTPFEQSLSKVADTLLHHYKLAKGPLVVILKEMSQFDKVKSDTSSSDTPSILSEAVVSLPKNASVDQIVGVLETSTPRTLEEIGNRLIATQEPKSVLNAICKILERNEASYYDRLSIKSERGGPPVEHIFSKNGLGCGLLIDWMSELQPEMLGEHPEVQMRLMFVGVVGGWRPLLVTLVAHRASWPTLHTCLSKLLDYNGEWNASSVLDLVSAVTRSPRVWQGRDKTTPKHYSPEDILRLSHTQIKSLVKYILEEASTPIFTADSARRSIDSRLPLLLDCCSRDDTTLLAAALGAEEQLQNEVAKIFLLLFYMKVPKVLRLLSDSFDEPLIVDRKLLDINEYNSVVSSSTSVVDKILHTLLTLLGEPQLNGNKRQLAESACRALSSRWGVCAVRGVRLVSALFAGSEQSAPRYNVQDALLATLEALNDTLFLTHNDALEKTLESIIKSRHNNKDQNSMHHRAAAILRRYRNVAPTMASAFVNKHRSLLSTTALLSMLEGREPASQSAPPQAIDVLQMDGEQSDITEAIQQLDWWGTRRGGAWGGSGRAHWLTSAISHRLNNSNSAVRNSALSLLPKLLSAAPNSKPAFTEVMQCLDPSHPDIASSVLEKLPELIVCMQEHASDILMKVFELGIKSNMNTESCIAKCVSTLNMFNGC